MRRPAPADPATTCDSHPSDRARLAAMRWPLRRLLALSVAALAALECRRTEGRESRRAAGRVRLAGVLPFRPPADGLVTEAELDRYIRVRRAAKGRSDEEAARAVGVDPEEFTWVRARIVEALVALDGRRIHEASAETYARTITSLKNTRKIVKDRETARTIDEQIAALEKERASFKRVEALPANVSSNARRVAARRAEIETLSP